MGDFSQTLYRIGAGFVAIIALLVWLWPEVDAFPWSIEYATGFLIALVVWILTEFKYSEEVLWRGSSTNDIALSKEIVELYRFSFRTLLNETNLWQFLPKDLYETSFFMAARYRRNEIFFLDRELQDSFSDFVLALECFNNFIATNTTPALINGELVIGFKPERLVTDEEYQRQLRLSQQADRLADDAWSKLEVLFKKFKKRCPQAFEN